MDREADLREGTGIRGSVTLLTKCLLSISMIIMSMIDLIAIGTRDAILGNGGICHMSKTTSQSYYILLDARL